MSKALEMLQRVNAALAPTGGWTDADTVNITPEGRAKLAELHAHELLQAYGVSDHLQAVVERVNADDPTMQHHWNKVRASAEAILNGGEDGYIGDAEHLFQYCKMLVAAVAVRQTGDFEGWDIDRLDAACGDFLARHLRPSNDYAPQLADTKARVLAGCRMTLRDAQFDQWLQDIDVFAAKAARHEYTQSDAHAMRAELHRVCTKWEGETDDPSEQRLIAQVRQQFDKVTTVAARFSLGPAHLAALEHQWRCYKFNRGIAPRIRDNAIGALQQYTITALKDADTFCWAPQTTQAVMAAAEGLPKECAPSVSALGDIAQMNRSGWWWFQEPVPVQTTNEPGHVKPVVALLWRYGLQDTPPLPDFPDLRTEPRVGLWMQTFVMARVPLGGREQDVCIPTTAWIWHDGTPLEAMPQRLLREYNRIYADGKMGDDYADPEETVAASLAFSKFFMAAAAWLRQKIVVESHGGGGIRQAARQLQREHKLTEMPRVRIVELRRSQYVKSEDVATDGTGRKLSVRFVVKGFWRNQFYPSRKEHAPKYIESYLKGPADAPLKAAAPTVYVVRR